MMSLPIFLLIGYFSVVCGDSFPTCGDCWCIPDNEGLGKCPTDWIPQTTFTASVISTFNAQYPINIYTLSCNPYKDPACQTSPPQEISTTDDTVCAFVYPQTFNGSTSCVDYSMKTFQSTQSALDDGAVLTHAGSCGLCSTAQDLAIYLTQDFTTAGKICATKGLFNEQAGLECYMDIGLTKECAKIWNYDGIYDGEVCGKTCATSLSDPNNGPAPSCTLNPCLQCDEDKAGPLFSQFAGRTRRRSGLLSEIVRDCDSIAHINHNPCVNPACGCSATTAVIV